MPKNIIFLPEAWEDFSYWLDQDKKMIKRICIIIQDIERNGFTGIGKPEPLKGNLSGWWSRRIDDKNRLRDYPILCVNLRCGVKKRHCIGG